VLTSVTETPEYSSGCIFNIEIGFYEENNVKQNIYNDEEQVQSPEFKPQIFFFPSMLSLKENTTLCLPSTFCGIRYTVAHFCDLQKYSMHL
jgi:hypothetical protein